MGSISRRVTHSSASHKMLSSHFPFHFAQRIKSILFSALVIARHHHRHGGRHGEMTERRRCSASASETYNRSASPPGQLCALSVVVAAHPNSSIRQRLASMTLFPLFPILVHVSKRAPKLSPPTSSRSSFTDYALSSLTRSLRSSGVIADVREVPTETLLLLVAN